MNDHGRRTACALLLSLWETRGALALWPLAVVARQVLRGAGLAVRSRDRRLLEDRILAYYAALPGPLEILSVGVRAYTAHYERLLHGHRYRTIDIDPRAARFGSSQGHVVDSVAAAGRHFAAGSFDLVLLNGVIGWGLNDRAEAEDALTALHGVLRDGGVLIVGWNDIALRRPFAPRQLQALRVFRRYRLPPLAAEVVETGSLNRHRFEFFVKPGAAVDRRPTPGYNPVLVGAPPVHRP